MKYARIENGEVAEIVDVEAGRQPSDFFHASLVFVEAPPGCAAGWRVQGGNLVAPPVDLARLARDKRAAIEAAYLAALARGCPFGEGDAIQIDAESRGNLAARATRAGFVLQGTAGFTWPEGGMPFRTKANLWPVFAPAAMVALSLQVDDLFTAIRVRYAALKDQLAAAATEAAFAALDDPETGWPN